MAVQVSYQTTAKQLKPEAVATYRQALNIFVDEEDKPIGDMLSYNQILIIDTIVQRRYERVQLILPTQYGKSFAVGLAVLWRVAMKKEKWAIIAPTAEKAHIIMDVIINHIFDDPMFIGRLEYEGPKEKLKQELSKNRITFNDGGEVRIYTADAKNTQNTKKALMGFGSPNIILDESALIPDDLYATIKRMLGGYSNLPGGTFLMEIGNPFFQNHFLRTWNSKRYTKVYVDYNIALAEGRYSQDYIDEMKDEAFFDVLYECKFPDEEQVPEGYRPLLSLSMIENAFIKNDLPLGHDNDGNVLDKPILGVDPNHGGSNYTAITIRYPQIGFAKILKRHRYEFSKNVQAEIGNDVIKFINDYDIGDYRTVIDSGGVGAGLVDWLEERGYYVTGVMFGQGAENRERYANRKAEIYMALRKWIMSGNGKLVQDDGFLELKDINYKENSTSKVQMETKEELGKRGVASPDVADSLALTFENVGYVDDQDDDII